MNEIQEKLQEAIDIGTVEFGSEEFILGLCKVAYTTGKTITINVHEPEDETPCGCRYIFVPEGGVDIEFGERDGKLAAKELRKCLII